MAGAIFFGHFFVWYFSSAFLNIFNVWKNFMWFILHFFSIPLLLKTLFSPWKRMTDTDRHRTIEEFFSGVIMNLMSRVFGAFVRLSIVTVGVIALTLGIFCLCLILLTWVFLPVLFTGSVVYGVMLLV